MPFLTDIDSRAKVSGSRDPLGLVPLWSRFGRAVVGNLTTVSNSVRGFTTLLLGYHFAREAQDRGASESTLDLFLKFEQLAAYSRWNVLNDEVLRGIERVKKTLEAAKGRVVLSAHVDRQILSNQRIYGLWGLFSGPARSSGLLDSHDTVLTPEAEEFVQREYLSRLTAAGDRDGRKVVELLAEKNATFEVGGRHAKLARTIADVHSIKFTSRERSFYVDRLLRCTTTDATSGRQQRLVGLFAQLPQGIVFDMSTLRELVKMARSRGSEWVDLAEKLEAILELELLLAPAANAFGFVLTRNGQTLDVVAKELRSSWGARMKSINPEALAALLPAISLGIDVAAATRLVEVARALAAGHYDHALRLLIEHNAAVMHLRGGAAPWVKLDRDRLDVRFRDERRELGSAKWLADPWTHTYFLDSLHTVHQTLRS